MPDRPVSTPQGPPVYAVGARVVVRWMGEDVPATIHSVRSRGYRGRPLQHPSYEVEIPGVKGYPAYLESEIRREMPDRPVSTPHASLVYLFIVVNGAAAITLAILVHPAWFLLITLGWIPALITMWRRP